MANSSYWTRHSPSPTEMSDNNASYWDSAHANTVYSTGKSPHKSAIPLAPTIPPGIAAQTKVTQIPKPHPVRPARTRSEVPSLMSNMIQPSKNLPAQYEVRKNVNEPKIANNRDPRKKDSIPDCAPESRDPRRRKRSAEGKFTGEIVSKRRDPPPDRPDTITRQNIELHRLVHESEKEWKLRRQFLLEHCENIPANQLECLSQVFINMECLGATYPQDVMERVRLLSVSLSRDLHHLREEKKVKIQFVKASDEIKLDAKPNVKPIAFVKPNTGDTNDEEHEHVKEQETEELEPKPETSQKFVQIDGTETEIFVLEETSPLQRKSRCKTSKRKTKIGDTSSDTMELVLENKRVFARNKCEETLYDLAFSLAKIENENKIPKNAVEYLYMAASWAKTSLEFNFSLASNGQKCMVLVNNVVLGDSVENNKKQAKRVAFERAVDRLKKPYLRVVRKNPERQELESSDRPFGGATDMPNMSVLGGGEVARRGMKNQIKSREDFILVNYTHQDAANSTIVLQQSADFNKVPLKLVYEEAEGLVICRVFLGHEEFLNYSAATKQLAKINAAELAVERLQATNWTIKIKTGADTPSTGLSRDEVLGDLSKVSEAIPESNIGNKLLKKMGWSGGGVGKSGQGIAEPIKAEITVVRREGFGHSSVKGLGVDFKKKVKMTLTDYCRSQRQDDMRFSPEFSNEERAIVHTEARKLGLRSKSYGQGDERYLVVGRKRTPSQLLAHIMAQGGSTSKYDLVEPRRGSGDLGN